MSYTFANEYIVCPSCKKGELLCTERNYSGCSVDIAWCEKCKKQFQVSYKVDEVKEIDWG